MDGHIENFLALAAEQRNKSEWWKLARFYLNELERQTGYSAKIGRFQIFTDATSEEFVGQIHVPSPLKNAGGDYWEGIFSISLSKKELPIRPASLHCDITAFPYSAKGKHIGLEEDIDYFQLTYQAPNWIEDGRISPEYPGEWDNYIEGAFWENLEASPMQQTFTPDQAITIALNLVTNEYYSANIQQWQVSATVIACNDVILLENAEGQPIQSFSRDKFSSGPINTKMAVLLHLDKLALASGWQAGDYRCILRADFQFTDDPSRIYISEISEPFSFRISPQQG